MFFSSIFDQVKKVIDHIIASGGKRDKRMDWEKIADEVLNHFKSVQRREIRNQKRLLTLGPDGEYAEEFRHEFDAAEVPRGHRHWLGKHNGIDGVWVMEKLGIVVQDEEVDGMELRSAYDNAGSDTMDDEKNQIFKMYGIDMLRRSTLKRSAAGARGSSPVARSPAKPGKEDARVDPSLLKADPSPDASAEDDGSTQRGGGTQRGTVSQRGGATTPKAPKPKAAKARGRPPRSIVQEASVMVESFSTSDLTHQLWWCGDMKTQLKKVKEQKEVFGKRIEKANGPDAAELVMTLEPWHKKLQVIFLLMEAHQKYGFDSDAFTEMYDSCFTSLRICLSLNLSQSQS